MAYVERMAKGVGPSNIDVVYSRFGSTEDPVALLIMGLGAQLVNWPEGLVKALVSRGLQVICFDNRDAGRSTHMFDAPAPDIPAALAGDLSSVSYDLKDMAADAVGLLQYLDIQSAHFVGASMGAAIAQEAAVAHPQRVRSLTSMMFTTGNPAVGKMDAAVQRKIFSGEPPKNKEEAIAQALWRAPIIRSPGYPIPSEEIARVAGLAWERDRDRTALARHAVATIASGDRAKRLETLRLPALVIHGTHDVICDVSGGRATAEVIPGAELLTFEGMSHDFPEALWPPIADAIARTADKGERQWRDQLTKRRGRA